MTRLDSPKRLVVTFFYMPLSLPFETDGQHAPDDAFGSFMCVRKIVVHGGLAHMDDIMSCAMAYAFGVPHDAPIERRNPQPGELDDLATLVLDIGGVHDPARLDFDHHQRARTDEPKCAFRLFGEWLGVDDEMRQICPWCFNGI